MSNITRNNTEGWLLKLWEVAQFYAEDGLNIQHDATDEPHVTEDWEDICNIMAWLREDLGLSDEPDTPVDDGECS